MIKVVKSLDIVLWNLDVQLLVLLYCKIKLACYVISHYFWDSTLFHKIETGKCLLTFFQGNIIKVLFEIG